MAWHTMALCTVFSEMLSMHYNQTTNCSISQLIKQSMSRLVFHQIRPTLIFFLVLVIPILPSTVLDQHGVQWNQMTREELAFLGIVFLYLATLCHPCTVTLVCKDHPRDQQNVVLIHRWSFYAGLITWKVYQQGLVKCGLYKQVAFITCVLQSRFDCIYFSRLQNAILPWEKLHYENDNQVPTRHSFLICMLLQTWRDTTTRSNMASAAFL